MTLIGSAFIFVFWMRFGGGAFWYPLAASVVYGIAMFRLRVKPYCPSRVVRGGQLREEAMDVKRRDVLKGARRSPPAAATVGGAAIISSTPSYAQQVDAAKKWIDSEFQPSTLSKDQQMAEMEWFIKASTPFKGMKVSTVSEILSIHDYESKTLTKAFAEITGIQVNHEMMDEGQLVDKIEVEIAVRQADLRFLDERLRLHRHASALQRHRRRFAHRLHGRRRQGHHQSRPRPQRFHRPFLRRRSPTASSTSCPTSSSRTSTGSATIGSRSPSSRRRSRSKFGYELGVPVNWSAYEDIADFFTNTVKEIDGQKVYGHMDYGKKDPSLGWRFTDAWLSMAGNGDRGLPNGKPVDEWGIRAEDGIPRRLLDQPRRRRQRSGGGLCD